MCRFCYQPKYLVLGLHEWLGGKLSLSEPKYTHLSNGVKCQVRMAKAGVGRGWPWGGSITARGWLRGRWDSPDWFIVHQGSSGE